MSIRRATHFAVDARSGNSAHTVHRQLEELSINSRLQAIPSAERRISDRFIGITSRLRCMRYAASALHRKAPSVHFGDFDTRIDNWFLLPLVVVVIDGLWADRFQSFCFLFHFHLAVYGVQLIVCLRAFSQSIGSAIDFVNAREFLGVTSITF